VNRLTNHALDQLLQGIIAFGETNVVRVGGRSSDEMKKYSYVTFLCSSIRMSFSSFHVCRQS
jgi:hypothetical protein